MANEPYGAQPTGQLPVQLKILLAVIVLCVVGGFLKIVGVW